MLAAQRVRLSQAALMCATVLVAIEATVGVFSAKAFTVTSTMVVTNFEMPWPLPIFLTGIAAVRNNMILVAVGFAVFGLGLAYAVTRATQRRRDALVALGPIASIAAIVAGPLCAMWTLNHAGGNWFPFERILAMAVYPEWGTPSTLFFVAPILLATFFGMALATAALAPAPVRTA